MEYLAVGTAGQQLTCVAAGTGGPVDAQWTTVNLLSASHTDTVPTTIPLLPGNLIVGTKHEDGSVKWQVLPPALNDNYALVTSNANDGNAGDTHFWWAPVLVLDDCPADAVGRYPKVTNNGNTFTIEWKLPGSACP